MAAYIVKHSFNLFKQKPIKLWGISVLCSIIITIITYLGLAVPIITIPINLIITAGMSLIYLNGYNGIMPDSSDLFAGFDKSKTGHIAGGMCWYKLWSIIWMFVPIANIVKSLQYAFTPYILMTRPEVSPTEALKCSIKETRGYKASMFFTLLLIFLAVMVAMVILSVLSGIRYIGGLFAFITFLYVIFIFMFLPLIVGVIMAGFYQEAQNAANGNAHYASFGQQYNGQQYNAQQYNGQQYNGQQYNGQQYNAQQYNAQQYNAQQWNPMNSYVNSESQNGWACVQCGTINAAGTKYCRACGNKNPEILPDNNQSANQFADGSTPQQ